MGNHTHTVMLWATTYYTWTHRHTQWSHEQSHYTHTVMLWAITYYTHTVIHITHTVMPWATKYYTHTQWYILHTQWYCGQPHITHTQWCHGQPCYTLTHSVMLWVPTYYAHTVTPWAITLHTHCDAMGNHITHTLYSFLFQLAKHLSYTLWVEQKEQTS